jgi:hypothetical protein
MWIIAHGPAFDTHEHGWALLAGNCFTLAALGFFAGVAAVLFRRRRSA